jgi:hypothetical protein
MAKTLWPNPHLIQFRLSLRGSRRGSDASETRNGFPPSDPERVESIRRFFPSSQVQIGNEKSFPLSDPERVESIRRFFPSSQVQIGNEKSFPPSDPERVAILQPWVARNALPRVLRTKPGNPERVESIRRFFPSFQVVLGNEKWLPAQRP